jgi:hypothetical protein
VWRFRLAFPLSEIVIDGDPAAILGALDQDIIPVAAFRALVNIYFTVIVVYYIDRGKTLATAPSPRFDVSLEYLFSTRTTE